MDRNEDISRRLNAVIPGGAHTYSRGNDQFPTNAPAAIVSGIGAYVKCLNDKSFLDYGMALRSVSIGYSDKAVNSAVISAIKNGNGFTRPSIMELIAAERFLECIPSAEMVKFCKNGSNATSAAIKLARAYTGREIVLRCSDHPFFSFDDWFIADTPVERGIPLLTSSLTKNFPYNNIDALQQLFEEYPDKISCIILEPAAGSCPLSVKAEGGCCGTYPCSRTFEKPNFLQKVQSVCKKHGALFILDETITGFRWDLGGAQKTFNVEPDLSTFGKAMANGFSVAALSGKREIMQLGAIDIDNLERTFLLSSTHGAEVSSLAAFVSTLDILSEGKVIPHLWSYGAQLIDGFNKLSDNAGMADSIFLTGPAANPILNIKSVSDVINDAELRTLYQKEMIDQGVLMPWVSISYSHSDIEMTKTLNAHYESLKTCKRALIEGLDKYYQGPTVKPVFRKYN